MESVGICRKKRTVSHHISTKENYGARYNDDRLVQIVQTAFQIWGNAEGPPLRIAGLGAGGSRTGDRDDKGGHI